MTGEVKDEHERWVQPSGRRVDLWDCEVYQLGLAEILGLKKMKKAADKPPAPKPKKKPARPEPRW